MDELQNLFQLQQLELELEKLQKTLKQLPVYAEFKQLQGESADAKEAFGWAQTKFNEQNKRVRRMESDLQDTEAKQQVVDSELYADTGMGAKELEKLDVKARALRQEHEEQEETLLLAMEGKDELEKAMQTAHANYSMLREKLVAMQKTGNAEIHRLKDDISRLQKQCDELLTTISEPLLTEYRSRRPMYQGRPLAQISKDICSGCRVGISSMTKSSLQLTNTTVYCENCGRLLVPAKRPL